MNAVMELERRGQPSPLSWANRFAGDEPLIQRKALPSCGGTSRINREVYVRFCERLGVKSSCPGRLCNGRSTTIRYTAVIPCISHLVTMAHRARALRGGRAAVDCSQKFRRGTPRPPGVRLRV